MAELDIDSALRWFRFDPEKRLVRRTDADLPFLDPGASRGLGLLLDTCVYIDQLRGRFPDPATQFITTRQVNHSTVAVQELMFGVGLLDPKDRRTPRTVQAIRALVAAMRSHRIFAPDPDLLARSAMMAGLLCRVQGYTGDSRKRALMDATLFLQAQKLGLMIVTANISDFDLLLQLIPNTRVGLYRSAA